jgi:hypothetical protein
VDALPRAVASLNPLAMFWDPLSAHAALMVILPGPFKVDLIADFPNPERRTAWRWPADGTERINAHFWDWALWLGARQLAGRDDLIRTELQKMQRAVLAAVGVEQTPGSLAGAIERYLAALRAQGFDALARDRLATEVQGALRRHGVVGT